MFVLCNKVRENILCWFMEPCISFVKCVNEVVMSLVSGFRKKICMVIVPFTINKIILKS